MPEDVEDYSSILSDEELDLQLSKLDRRRILSMLVDLIEKLYQKSLYGRIEKVDNEKVRVSYAKAMGYLIQIYTGLIRDVDFSEMQDRLTELERLLDEKGKY